MSGVISRATARVLLIDRADAAEPVVPVGLGGLMTRLLTGPLPAVPVVLPWHLAGGQEPKD